MHSSPALVCSSPLRTFCLMLARIDHAGSASCRLQATLLVLPHCDLRCPVDMMGGKSVEETDVNGAQCTHVAAWREIHGLIYPPRIYSWVTRSAVVTGGLTHVTIPPTACRISNTCVFLLYGEFRIWLIQHIYLMESATQKEKHNDGTFLDAVVGLLHIRHALMMIYWSFEGIWFSIFRMLSTDASRASLTFLRKYGIWLIILSYEDLWLFKPVYLLGQPNYCFMLNISMNCCHLHSVHFLLLFY